VNKKRQSLLDSLTDTRPQRLRNLPSQLGKLARGRNLTLYAAYLALIITPSPRCFQRLSLRSLCSQCDDTMMSVFRVLSFCYLIRVAISQVEAQTSVTPLQSSSASFQYPRATESLTVNVVDTIVVEWKSNFPQNAFLYLWCDNGVPGAPNNRKCKPCLPISSLTSLANMMS
jgi:hypothetical protein